VVDDNRDTTDLLAMLLTSCGHDVTTACDGIEALDNAERVRPEVIL
jgi:CheY-like chemotaxis protein